jgi:uncharacterized membrane protein YhaH (DUF805 family)
MDWNWYLFSFKGRINRAKFWLSVPILLGWTLLIMWLMLATITAFTATRAAHGHETLTVNFGISELFTLLGRACHLSLSTYDSISLAGNVLGLPIVIWICLATSVKRLHDRDRSGWWIVLFFVLPSFSNNIIQRLPGTTFDLPVGLALIALSIWGFIELGFLRGSRSTNLFGPNPLGKQQARPRNGATTLWQQQSEVELAPHIGSPPPPMRVKRGA